MFVKVLCVSGRNVFISYKLSGTSHQSESAKAKSLNFKLLHKQEADILASNGVCSCAVRLYQELLRKNNFLCQGSIIGST